MGLGSFIGKFGKEWGEQAAQGSQLRHLVGGPPMLAGIGGAAIGAPSALFSAANGSDDPLGDGLQGAAIGAAGLGGVGALAAGTMGMKQLIVAIARAMKQKMPEAADNEIMLNAQRVVQDAMSRPDARAQLEKILGKMNWGPRDPGSPY